MVRTEFVANVMKRAGLLLLGGLASLHTMAAELPPKLWVQFDDGLVSISAVQVPVAAIVTELATAAELRLVQHVALERVTSVRMQALPLDEALAEILEAESYQLYQNVSDSVPGTLWVFSAGSEQPPHATLFFEAVLLHGGYAEKREAIRDLRRLGTPYAVQTLSLALGDDDARVPAVALEALAAIGGDDAMAAIASATAAADPWVRGDAVAALATGDSGSARQYLELAFTDPDPNVRRAVIEAYADNAGGQSVKILSEALNDEDPTVRRHAVDVLEAIGGDVAFEAMLRARSDRSEDVREAAEESLSLLMQQP